MINSVKRILLVDDEQRLLNSMGQRLALMGFEVMKASSGNKAIELAKLNKIDLAIVDLKMPDMDGLVTITRLKELVPDLRTVLLTGYGSQKIKNETSNLGSDYFEKDSMADLWNLIKGFNNNGDVIVIQPSGSNKNLNPAKEDLSDSFGSNPFNVLNDNKKKISPLDSVDRIDSIGEIFTELPKIIGETPDMQLIRKNIERYSRLDCSIIIQGETGTGKEMAAKAIHALSHRKNQRFLAFNCGCFSDDFHFDELLNSIEQSISSNKTGETTKRFVGTLLLDHFEIMPERTQSEMIKIIDTKNQSPSGESAKMPLDIRFIVATHQDLKKRVTEGKFSERLYQKLNAISLFMPSLRDRREDIYPLSSYFLNTLNNDFKKNINSISDEVFSVLMSYPFPGNVRELKHIIERAVILADEPIIKIKHLPERFNNEFDDNSQKEGQPFLTISEMENRHIIKAINFTKGNKSKAAEILGISRGALWRKLKKIDDDI